MSDQPLDRAQRLSVYGLFAAQVNRVPDAVALEDGDESWTYRELDQRVRHLATILRDMGVGRGDRIAICSENRHEYVEVELAAALIGAIVACQNWRLAADELTHCINLVEPNLIAVSERFADTPAALGFDSLPVLTFGEGYETALAAAQPLAETPEIDPEDGLVILYTSGTTGLPKGALISHRAEIARMTVFRMDLGLASDDGFVAWAPMFHMVSTDQGLATLMSGGTVYMVDGFQPKTLTAIMMRARIGWMVAMPGAIEPLIAALEEAGGRPKGVRVIGAMADLVPRSQIAALSRLTGAPYLNSFGATETGLPPATADLVAPGVVPENLHKVQSSLCDVRLLDPDGNDVPHGEPGEAAVRGPTVFSGYWNAPEVNAEDFRDGWFRMGDLFRRTKDGKFDFVDRVKYMIKSGGENIYPAEIEQVLLADPRVLEAVVIRQPDAQWGEVPVAVIARDSEDLDEAEVERLCREALAGYKRPKAVHFIPFDAFPRSTTGKVQRHEVEAQLAAADG